GDHVRALREARRSSGRARPSTVPTARARAADSWDPTRWKTARGTRSRGASGIAPPTAAGCAPCVAPRRRSRRRKGWRGPWVCPWPARPRGASRRRRRTRSLGAAAPASRPRFVSGAISHPLFGSPLAMGPSGPREATRAVSHGDLAPRRPFRKRRVLSDELFDLLRDVAQLRVGVDLLRATGDREVVDGLRERGQLRDVVAL